MSRRNYQYSRLGEASRTLYDAYKSNAGRVVQGVLEGGLGATIAGMSAVADEKMMGVHVALGGIWLSLTTKNYAEAGNNYLNKRTESLDDLGVEILAYAKLRAAQEPEANPETFIKKINTEILANLNNTLKENNYPELEEHDIKESTSALENKEVLQSLIERNTRINHANVLVAGAAIGAALTVGGVVGTAVAGKTAGTLSATAIGATGVSVAGGLLGAQAASSKEIAQRLSSGLQALTAAKFPDADLESERAAIRTEESERALPRTSAYKPSGSGIVAPLEIAANRV